MKITLIAPHEHAGVAYPAGAEIEVPETDAAWLVKNNVAVIGGASIPLTASAKEYDPVDPLTVAASAARAVKGAR